MIDGSNMTVQKQLNTKYRGGRIMQQVEVKCKDAAQIRNAKNQQQSIAEYCNIDISGDQQNND